VAFVEYRNTGTATWQAPGTRLGTTGPRDRRGAFYDTANWVAPNRPSTVDAPTAPGATGRFSFVLGIPEVTTAQTVTDTYALVQEGVGWFGPADDAVRCAVRVTPRVVDAGAADATADVPVDVAVVDAPDAGDAWDDGDSPDAGDAWADASDAADAVAEAGDGGATFGDEGDPEAIEGGCQCRAGSPTGKARPGPFVLLAALGMALRRRRRRGRP
jgi:MYXO-CTERM domain-containing protein